ncbi:protocadherin gamma-B5-like [Rhinophrynus dorsalis]
MLSAEMHENISYGIIQAAMSWQVIFSFLCFLCKPISGQLQYSVYEEQKQGFVIGNIANDLNVNVKELSVRKFHIVSRAKQNNFNVNLENGDLYVADRIDRELLCGIQQNCVISIEAIIENPLQFYTVQVEIHDINDNSPTFSKKTYEIVISESALPGTRFALGTAKDPDIGTNSIQNYTLSANEFFILGIKNNQNGRKYPELVVEKTLDREKISKFDLILTAFDGGKPIKSGTGIIKIVIHDINDNYPVFKKEIHTVSVNESAPIGFLVLYVNATDEDEGINAQITYSFNDIPEDAHQIFAINPLDGAIKIIGKLDYEVRQSYEITVEAKDGGGLAAYSKVSILIIDINDNAPEITVSSFSPTIPEDSPIGTIIALINIDDFDSGKNGEVVCQISETSPFQLISSSSNYYKLVTTINMDRESDSEFNITIQAADKGSPQLSTSNTVRLFISDVNDNPPVFEKTNYFVYVAENNLPGTSIYRVHATDLDLNENGKIVYSLLTSDIEDIPVSSYVSVNSVTGVIYAQRSFDYEDLREFQIQVMAKDSGFYPLHSNVTVRICILDNNDNAPKILYPSPDTEATPFFELIPHFSSKGYLISKIVAVDADSGHNAWLSYHLLQKPEPSLFTIGQHTGEIRIARDFQDTDNVRQRVIIMVKDNGFPSLSATATLNLLVAENFQHVLPEISNQPIDLNTPPNLTFYLVISISLISILFILTAMGTVISKCKKINAPSVFGTMSRDMYPQVALRCPSQFSDGSLPFPYSYDVCVALDSSQNEFAYLKTIQNVPTGNLIDTNDSATGTDPQKDSLSSASITQVL